MPDRRYDDAVERALAAIESELNMRFDMHQAIVVRNVLHRLVDQTKTMPHDPWEIV